MSLLRCKYLNELCEMQDFRPVAQRGQRSTCHHLHMAARTLIKSIAIPIPNFQVSHTGEKYVVTKSCKKK